MRGFKNGGGLGADYANGEGDGDGDNADGLGCGAGDQQYLAGEDAGGAGMGAGPSGNLIGGGYSSTTGDGPWHTDRQADH